MALTRFAVNVDPTTITDPLLFYIETDNIHSIYLLPNGVDGHPSCFVLVQYNNGLPPCQLPAGSERIAEILMEAIWNCVHNPPSPTQSSELSL